MSKIQVNRYGKILSGEDTGCYLFIEQEDPSYDDFLVIVSDINDTTPFAYGYDYFLTGQENLFGLFEENKWKIKWLLIRKLAT